MAKTEKKVIEKIIPSLQFAVLCDGIVGPDQRGKVSFIGVFDKFLKPGVIPNFALAIGWKNGKGNFKFKVKLLDPELNQLFETHEMDVILKYETDAGRAFLNIGGMNFSKAGVYWIEILLDNETVQSIPIPVEEGKQLH